MVLRFLLSLLLFCQGLLLISAYTGEGNCNSIFYTSTFVTAVYYLLWILDGVKVEETDWLDISADLADVDDNTLDSQEIDENMVMLEDLQLNDDDDDNGVMEFDEGTL